MKKTAIPKSGELHVPIATSFVQMLVWSSETNKKNRQLYNYFQASVVMCFECSEPKSNPKHNRFCRDREGKKLVGILHMEMKNKSCSFPILLTLIDVKKKSYVCALFSIQNLYCINMDAHTKVIKILKNNESEFPNWNGEAMHLYGYSM